MSKILFIQIEVGDDALAGGAAYYDCGELVNLLTGIDSGEIAGRVTGVLETSRPDSPAEPVVQEVPEVPEIGDALQNAGFAIHATRPVETVEEGMAALSVFPKETKLAVDRGSRGGLHYVTYDGGEVTIGYDD